MAKGKKTGGIKRVSLLTKVIQFKKEDGTLGAPVEIGLFKDKYNWIIRINGNSEDDCFYSDFGVFIRDIYQISFSLGLKKFELSHIQSIHRSAMRLIEGTTELANNEIKDLQKKLNKKELEIYDLHNTINGLDKRLRNLSKKLQTDNAEPPAKKKPKQESLSL